MIQITNLQSGAIIYTGEIEQYLFDNFTEDLELFLQCFDLSNRATNVYTDENGDCYLFEKFIELFY